MGSLGFCSEPLPFLPHNVGADCQHPLLHRLGPILLLGLSHAEPLLVEDRRERGANGGLREAERVAKDLQRFQQSLAGSESRKTGIATVHASRASRMLPVICHPRGFCRKRRT